MLVNKDNMKHKKKIKKLKKQQQDDNKEFFLSYFVDKELDFLLVLFCLI